MAAVDLVALWERVWREQDHPRGPGGKFGSGSGSAARAKPGADAGKRRRAPAPPAGGKAPGAGSGSSGTSPSRAGRSRDGKASDAAPKAGAASVPPKDKAFLDSHYGEWRDKLTPAQDKAMRFYQSPGYALMNGQLRGLDNKDIKADVSFNDADLARARKASTDLKSAIKKAPPLDEPMTVYRGFSADQFDLTPGKTITDKGFVSTSITNDVGSVGKATKQATAEITLPKGTKAAAGSAREMVLPPGSKFKITSVTTRKGVPHVTMELML